LALCGVSAKTATGEGKNEMRTMNDEPLVPPSPRLPAFLAGRIETPSATTRNADAALMNKSRPVAGVACRLRALGSRKARRRTTWLLRSIRGVFRNKPHNPLPFPKPKEPIDVPAMGFVWAGPGTERGRR
jgi:hypothetical protein